jgi:hypothetical protein
MQGQDYTVEIAPPSAAAPDPLGMPAPADRLQLGRLRTKSLARAAEAIDTGTDDTAPHGTSEPGKKTSSIEAGGLRAFIGEGQQMLEACYEQQRAGNQYWLFFTPRRNGEAKTYAQQVTLTQLDIEGESSSQIEYSLSADFSGLLAAAPRVSFEADGSSYDASSGTWADGSVFKHDATAPSSAAAPGLDTSGAFSFLTFDGTDDQLSISSKVFPPGSWGFTLTGVARLKSDRNHTLIGGGADGTASEIDLDTQDSSDRLSLRIGTAPVISSPAGSIALGKWFAFLVSYKPGAGRSMVVGDTRVEDDIGDIGRATGAYSIGAERDDNFLDGELAHLLVGAGTFPLSRQDALLNDLRSTYNL